MHHPHLMGRLLLRLALPDSDEETPHNLSAAAREGEEHLWLASDERGFLERLSLEPGRRSFGEHERFRLADALTLEGEDPEIDIEALDLHGDQLWAVGSHSSKRKKPKAGKNSVRRLATVERPQNRLLLGRFPLSTLRNGVDQDSAPARMLPTWMEGDHPVNPLLEALTDDEHLGPFLQLRIPSKDNGFDLEGLVACGNALALGLRGPVLRGYAVLLLLEVADEGQNALKLVAKKGRSYRKLFLDLDGLGIRELTLVGEDLLILAGPTQALDGAIRLFRLRDPFSRKADAVIERSDGDLVRLFDLPHVEGGERAEGVALYSWFDPDDSVLVVYDRPAEERLLSKHDVLADVFRLSR